MKLKVWTVINPPHYATFIPIDDDNIDQAKALIQKLIDEQLGDKEIWSNAFGLVYWDETDKQWEEWYSEDGNDILEVIKQDTEPGGKVMAIQWQPWEDFKGTKPTILPIPEPPCSKGCEFWQPHAEFNRLGELKGVECCIAEAMYNDFSCYRPIPEQEG